MTIDHLLDQPAFGLTQEQKLSLFLPAMEETHQWHYAHSREYKKYIDSGLGIKKLFATVADVPFVPIQIFKELELSSVPTSEVKTKILSSATTTGVPSTIVLDAPTIKRQQKVLIQILTSFLGKDRRTFFIIDSSQTSQKKGMHTPSRASAIRGFALLSKSIHFILDEDLRLSEQLWQQAVSASKKGDPICVMGFTWILFTWMQQLYEKPKLFRHVQKEFRKLSSDLKVLHLGGWKKLKDRQITKEQFNTFVSQLLSIPVGNIIDVYGMTEQLGTVYMDCSFGRKHVPTYSEVVIRDPYTLSSLPPKTPGLIQLLTPLPHSYPGFSILTEDMGEITGVDDCPCGRKGVHFKFLQRVAKAPAKGCGDTR